MAEVDSIFTIKQLYSNIEIARAFLTAKGINDPALLLEALKNSGGLRVAAYKKGAKSSSEISLEDVLTAAFVEANDQKKVGRLKKYRMHGEILLDELKKHDRTNNNNPFHKKIPILVNGLCVTDYRSGRKSGIDPYSNSHLFSTLFIEAVNGRFPFEFLDMFRLVYVQPVPYIQTPAVKEEFSEISTHYSSRQDSPNEFYLDNELIGLEEMLRGRIEAEVNPEIHAKNGIGFGALIKFGDIIPKRGNSVYDPALLSLKQIEQVLKASPDLVSEDATFNGVIDLKKYLELKRYEIHLNTQVMAIKFAQILDLMFPHIIETMKEYGIRGIPLYMEKTSDSARIIENTLAYSETPLKFHFVGGEQGILASTPELMPFMGICHPTAIGRLIGFIENVYMTWSKRFVKSARRVNIKPKEIINKVRYQSVDEYPFFLLENGTRDKHPNIHDLAKEILSEDEAGHVREFAYTHRIGFSRIEPRIVELMTRDTSIYCGFRTMDKSNRRWLQELDGKKIITSDMIPGFFEMPSIKNARVNDNSGENQQGGPQRIKSDFRGSEFSLPTSPRLDHAWFAKYYEHISDDEGSFGTSDTGASLDIGCSIEKIITSMQREKRKELLKEQLSREAQDVVEEFFRTHTQEMESIFAIRGTAIHKVSSTPLDGLVHYDTLRKAGIEPRASDCYTETPFLHTITAKDLCYLKSHTDLKHRITRPFTVSIHPDAYLFLEREDTQDTYSDGEKSNSEGKINIERRITKNYDLIILDTKTNRVTPYPEHKYLLQTFFYGWLIKHIVEEELGLCEQGISGQEGQYGKDGQNRDEQNSGEQSSNGQHRERVKVHNIYTVLNKNAFYRGFYNKGDTKREEPMPHATYREQKFSPITLFTPDDIMHEVILNMLGNIIEEKEGIQHGNICFADYKSQQEKHGRCEKCYMEHQLVCKLLKEKSEKEGKINRLNM
ncbi:hypothetical protein HY636_03250 [Candidatus Woesearchaeota archaeon]|nr:hypothetical protein [Candidatus Woesearchaeota archaeon]